jgi:hypothetical protein
MQRAKRPFFIFFVMAFLFCGSLWAKDTENLNAPSAQQPLSLTGEWQARNSIFGIRPVMRYNADFTYESGLITPTGKYHQVSKGSFRLEGNTIIETTTSVARGFYGRVSRIKAGETVIHVTILKDGTIRSEDNPFGGKTVFKKR